MKNLIVKLLKNIEREKKVKVLFAIESGSRACGISSANSDYDVRFVFVRDLEDYFSINPPTDVITKTYDKEGNPMAQEGCMLDMMGFDIHKFMRMLFQSNPNTIEWLRSKIVYCGELNEVCKDFAENQFKKISLYFHYKSMCRQNYIKYLKSGNLVTYKKYLYAMRGLVNAKWVAHKGTLPPMEFPETLNELRGKDIIDEKIIGELQEMIKLKKLAKEKDIVQNNQKIDSYIEEFLKNDDEAPEHKQLSTIKTLDDELKKIVMGGVNKYE